MSGEGALIPHPSSCVTPMLASRDAAEGPEMEAPQLLCGIPHPPFRSYHVMSANARGDARDEELWKPSTLTPHPSAVPFPLRGSRPRCVDSVHVRPRA